MSAMQESPESHRHNLLLAALSYAARGWRVFPLQPNNKIPFRGTRGFLDATTDEAQIRDLWAKWPRANIGIATGNGLVVIDEDTYKGADAAAWMLPVTLTAQTARGGRHWYFSYDGALSSVPEGKLAKGICIKATGGYVVAEPSTYEGKPYTFHDLAQPLAQLPERIAKLIRGEPQEQRQSSASRPTQKRTDRDTSGEHWVNKAVDRARSSGRNNAGIWLAQQLVWNDCDDPEGAMRYYARLVEDWDTPYYTEREALASLAQARKHAKREPARSRAQPIDEEPINFRRARGSSSSAQDTEDAASPEDTSADEALHCTDMGNARRFVKRHGRDVRYVAVWGKWLSWDGRRWHIDETEHVMRLAKDTVRAIYQEAADTLDDTLRRDLVKWATRSENDSRLRALLAQAQSEPEVACAPSQFDADPWALNVLNGTIDLHTGALRKHNREDYLTKLAPVEHNPKANEPIWNAFLENATNGNKATMTFLQRAVGYTLTGDTSEEKLFFPHGPTRTGKSTFVESVKAIMGDYAKTADFETFLARGAVGAPRNDIADLAGARMVASIEVDDGKKLAEGLVKMLTGGDTVKARHLYKEGFEFRPQFKLWLAANHEPRVDAADDAMWTRILRIPFDQQIPKEKRDPRVKATLRDPSKGGPAILAWALQGCLDWQREGLGIPDEVTRATDDYRQNMHPLKTFIVEYCVTGESRHVTAAELWGAYQEWVKEGGVRFPLTREQFARALESQKCTAVVKKIGGKATRCWVGVGLRSDDAEFTV